MQVNLIVLSICISQAAFAQSSFKIEQEKILKQARALDSAVYQVGQIEFKKAKFNRSKINTSYAPEKGKTYIRKHKIRHQKAGRMETIVTFLVNVAGNKVKTVSKIIKVNGSYWYVEIGESKLLVDKYLLVKHGGSTAYYYNY